MNLTRMTTQEKKAAKDIGQLCWWHNWCDDDCKPDMFVLKSICTLAIGAVSCLSCHSWQFECSCSTNSSASVVKNQ